ncbi:MAG TPA: efflux RND transporter periplasmic adaptor subunit [Kofleriaceae bacterium]|jgi:RND family efflux transporter MFP subunit
MSAAAKSASGAAKVIGVVIALGVSGLAFALASHYRRPPPPTDTPAPGMTLGSDSVTLAKDAPMWSSLKIGKAQAPQALWSDPVPAKVMFDEQLASRIGSPLAGRVQTVSVERGQRVKKGDPLFSVVSANLADMHSDASKAKLDQATARTNRDRVKALVDAGAIPAKELVAAEQELAAADLAVSTAGQKISSLRVGAGGGTGFTVTAPRDGVVVEKTISVGQNVDPSNGSVMAIADLSEVWVVADLFETDAAGLQSGAKAKVKLGVAEVEAPVDQVSQIVDPDRHTVPVRVRLPNPDGSFRPNAYAQISFLDTSDAKATLPVSAILSDGDTSYVYVNLNGTLKRRTIHVGAVTGTDVRVIDGLEPGDLVVVQGAILLDNQIALEDG